MIRKVAFGKAMGAGALGAVAWEAVARPFLVAGATRTDIVFVLGTLLAPPDRPMLWYPIGLAAHALVGAIWALVYGYFFWATWPWPPLLQGLAFALVPWLLASVAMLPQLTMLHPLVARGGWPAPGLFGAGNGWPGVATVFLGHATYGAVLGALYTHPVGHPVTAERRGALPPIPPV